VDQTIYIGGARPFGGGGVQFAQMRGRYYYVCACMRVYFFAWRTFLAGLYTPGRSVCVCGVILFSAGSCQLCAGLVGGVGSYVNEYLDFWFCRI